MKIAIYHNPRCSKSRATLDLLRNKGIEPDIIEYLNHPPDKQSLQRLLVLLGMEPRELMRTQETAYREAGLDNPSLDREQLVDAMVEHPVLIERPIVVANGKAVIGRPPEKVLEIL
ncbi:MAG: arsenate reductase (glutaredoxin) [Gammaproteobacteria bacterium]